MRWPNDGPPLGVGSEIHERLKQLMDRYQRHASPDAPHASDFRVGNFPERTGDALERVGRHQRSPERQRGGATGAFKE